MFSHALHHNNSHSIPQQLHVTYLPPLAMPIDSWASNSIVSIFSILTIVWRVPSSFSMYFVYVLMRSSFIPYVQTHFWPDPDWSVGRSQDLYNIYIGHSTLHNRLNSNLSSSTATSQEEIPSKARWAVGKDADVRTKGGVPANIIPANDIPDNDIPDDGDRSSDDESCSDKRDQSSDHGPYEREDGIRFMVGVSYPNDY